MIIARVGALAYRLQLPASMSGVHPVFHVSMLRKYLKDLEQKMDAEPLTIQQDLTMECHSVRILDFSDRVMRNRTIKYVKVLWTNQSEREATWTIGCLYVVLFPNHALVMVNSGTNSFKKGRM